MQKNKKKLKIAICGLGTFANKRLLPALKNVKEMELVAVVSKCNKKLDNQFNVEKYKNLDDMLNNKELDVVHISSPNFLHFKQTLECLKFSKDVICEKPVALNSKHAEKMLFVARSENCHLLVGHMLRNSPALLKVKSIIENKYLGDLLFLEFILNYSIDPLNRKWVFNKEQSGGGCVIDAGIHCIDLAKFLTGKDWYLLSSLLDKNIHKIDTKAKVLMQSEQVKCKISINSEKEYSSMLKVVGTNSTLHVKDFSATWNSAKFEIFDNKEVKICKYNIDVSSVYKNQYNQFSSILSKRNMNYSILQDAIKSLKLIEEIYKN